MVPCYDCGQPIPDEQIIRRFVQTGTSSGSRSSRFYYHKVNLCPACAASRGKANRVFLLVALAVGGSLVMSCMCCGILGNLILKKNIQKTDVPTTDVQTFRLTATVTWIGPPGTRKIGIQHGGIPGIPAGDHSIDLAPEASLPNASVGQQVECILELRNGRWVVRQTRLDRLVALPDNKPLASGNKPLVSDTEKLSDVIHMDRFRDGPILGISPDLKTFATIRSFNVEIADVKSKALLASLKCKNGGGLLDSVVFGRDVIAVRRKLHELSLDGDVRILSLKTGDVIQDIDNRRIRDLAFTADGRFLAATATRARQEGRAKAQAAGEKQREINHDGILLTPPPLAPLPLATPQDSLVIYDVQTKKLIADVDLGGHDYYTLAVAGGYAALYGMESDRIVVVEVEAGRLIKQFNAGSIRKRKVTGSRQMPFSISPKGNLLACVVEKKVIIYDIASNTVVHKLEGHHDPYNTVWIVAFSPNGKFISSFSIGESMIRFWDVEQGKAVYALNTSSFRLSRFPEGTMELVFSTDGNRIAVMNRRGYSAAIWNVELKWGG